MKDGISKKWRKLYVMIRAYNTNGENKKHTWNFCRKTAKEESSWENLDVYGRIILK